MKEESQILRSLFLQWLLVQLFPRLREWPVREWPMLLSKARQIEFDRLEQIATLAGVILVTWQIKPVTSLDPSVLLGYLAQFAYLAPILLLALGPFFVRRIRRGVNEAAQYRDAEIEEKDSKQ